MFPRQNRKGKTLRIEKQNESNVYWFASWARNDVMHRSDRFKVEIVWTRERELYLSTYRTYISVPSLFECTVAQTIDVDFCQKIPQNTFFNLIFGDFSKFGQKPPKFDFQSQCSMSNISLIFLYFFC